jgi:uncharacterized damage-inducible protein DinB
MSANEVVERYAAGGPLLLYAVAGLTQEQVVARPGPGAWSIAELVGHVLDTDLVYSDRMKRVIAEDEPVLQAFQENPWVARLDSQNIPVDDAASLFAANRKWMTRILRTCSESDFGRVGMHTESGRQTLAFVVTYMINHIDHHLRFLYGKRGNLGAAITPRYTTT